ncbi:uncharacterized protein K452DRAFT_300828 [Aplosporella prunicola CBS 121167]|uniref:AAA+ ATPase domain-containing protein n=1 Tax=Aplosporella prunicola CBS 121167 TaxID=1176127 RepID=A0A6A6B4H9_9PEZI|nr:uncharacterized protein K452DRAFT_300828 [Aplosporella prunicola CBS 121167]KAF2138746.1 hypothetical protein K452DRAFT_300828 [Aplosporella prunicola CBS 121167]
MNLGDQPNLHPFFSKAQRNQSPELDEIKVAQTGPPAHDENHPNHEEAAQRPRGRGRPLGSKTHGGKRKSGEALPVRKVKQASLVQFAQTGNSRKQETDDNAHGASAQDSLVEDPNIGRRKRQRTNSPEANRGTHEEAFTEAGAPDAVGDESAQPGSLSWHEQLEAEAGRDENAILVQASSPGARDPELTLNGSEAVADSFPLLEEREEVTQTIPPVVSSPPQSGLDDTGSALEDESSIAIASTSSSKPGPKKKMLRLKANGRFSSPVSIAPPPPSSPPSISAIPKEIEPIHEPVHNSTLARSSPPRRSPPRKMLRLNAKGRLSSPIPQEPPVEEPKPRRTRGRGRNKEPKQLIVKISYKKGDSGTASMAEDINRIMIGAQRAPAQKQKQPSMRPEPSGPPKPTHPFFSGKPVGKTKDESKDGPPEAAVQKSPLKTAGKRETAITPGKLRAQARANHATADDFPSFGFNTKTRKHPGGTVDAPWPWKGVVRVGNDSGDSPFPQKPIPSEDLKARRKLKDNVYQISGDESILSALCTHIRQDPLASLGFTPNSQSPILRKPNRLLTTGVKIQESIRDYIGAFASTGTSSVQSSEVLAEDCQLKSSQYTTHPALKTLYDEIENTLTPFDQGTCEKLPWAQKYAPKRAVDVLGSAREVAVLREWLEALRVSAVEAGSKETPKNQSSKKKGAMTKPPKKKRKKTADMDDFVVDDDVDALGGLDEVSDPDELASLDSGQGARKSMIRQGDGIINGIRTTKLSNVVLLSGPHGSGKTAAIFAVARELGFEIFEINSGSRRSGKDVFDKIGDMTENHLVQRKARESVATTADQAITESDSEQRLADAVQKDIESGRQKSMASFFKPTNQPKPKTSKPDIKEQPKKASLAPKEIAQGNLGDKPKQSQKQSLILLEEVDVLFEEDKNFWTTVESLALSSKRPIILTCTDESLVRMHETSFHAILRMSSPPAALATDYMLLLAAREGHLLERDAVSSLYDCKNQDLRASIMELDFWCQMGVGDQKGGLEWMYQRWPPGKDVDENGRTLRVASCGAYQKGMGWVSRDLLLEPSHAGFDREHEFLRELTESWHLQTEECTTSAQRNDPEQRTDQAISQESNLKSLEGVECSLDMLSAADVFCKIDVPARTKVEMDATQPPMPEKAKSSYIDGYPLIQADQLHDFTNFDANLAISSHLATSRYYCRQAPKIESQPIYTDLVVLPLSNETHILNSILTHIATSRDPASKPLSRVDFFAFDPLAEPPTNALVHGLGITASSFDRNFSLITIDLAPYVRSIAAWDLRLESERVRVSNLLSAGGTRKRKARTTRAARSAQEGGRRETVRKERWFDKKLSLQAVLATAGKDWAGLGGRERGEDDKQTETDRTSDGGSEHGMDTEG